MCTRLLKRFKRVPSPASGSGQELVEHHQEQLAFQITKDSVLNLIWSLASLCAAEDVPFAEEDARPFFQDLLLYIAHESDVSIMHALVCTLRIVLNRLHAPSAAAHVPAPAPEAAAGLQDKSATAHTLLNVLSQVLLLPRLFRPQHMH
jgi:hypothetical protein